MKRTAEDEGQYWLFDDGDAETLALVMTAFGRAGKAIARMGDTLAQLRKDDPRAYASVQGLAAQLVGVLERRAHELGAQVLVPLASEAAAA